MAVPRPLRRALSETLRVDASALTAAQPLRIAVGVVASLAAGIEAGGYAVGAAAAAGSLSAGLASLDVEGRPRFGRVTATCIGMAIATFIGSATGAITWVHLVATVAWVAACGYLVAVEPLAMPVGLNSIVAFLVFGRFVASPGDALRSAGFVAAGGGIQLVLTAALRRPPRARRELRDLGAAYRALGAYARAVPGGGSSLAAAATVEKARSAVLASAVRGVSREAWESLVDEAWRIRLQLIGMAEARIQLERAGVAADRLTAVDAVVEAAGGVLGRLGDVLTSTADPEALLDALAHLDASVTLLFDDAGAAELTPEVAGTWELVQAAAEAVGGQLRAASALVSAAGSMGVRLDPFAGAVRRRLRGVEGVAALAGRLLANVSLESAALRHAVRLAAVVLVATLTAHALGLDRGYWIGVTAALVLRPDYSATMSRGINRAAGTVLGVGVASVVAVTVHPEGIALGAVIGVFTWVAAATLTASYFLFSVAITGVVVFLLATVDPSPVYDAEERLIATAIGAALSLLAYALWPTWGRAQARRSLAELALAERDYVVRVLETAAEPSSAAAADLGGLDRRLRRARTNAEANVEQSLADPSSHRIDRAWAEGVLAALRRTSLAAHAIRARVTQQQAGWRPAPELTPLAEAAGPVLGTLAEAITAAHRAPPRTRELRALHRRLSEQMRAPDRAWLIVETDEIVDAIGTLAHLLGGEAPLESAPALAVRV